MIGLNSWTIEERLTHSYWISKRVFEKAFDTPSLELIKSKLFSGLGGKTLKWIDSFLCFRQCRVVVNGVKSDRAPVLSGVSQDTILGPFLFSLYINDIPSDIESEIRLFADDCLLSWNSGWKRHNETSEGYWSIVLLGKETGYEISTCQMQYDAAVLNLNIHTSYFSHAVNYLYEYITFCYMWNLRTTNFEILIGTSFSQMSNFRRVKNSHIFVTQVKN